MPWLIPAAIAASAVIGGGASLLASSKAADASQKATDSTVAEQQAALATQQGNTAVARSTGDAALNALAQRYGLVTPTSGVSGAANGYSTGSVSAPGGAGPGAGSPNLAGQPDWNAYLAADPGIMQEYNKQSPGHLAALGVSTPQEFAQWHYNTVGQYDGHTLPTYQAAAPETAAPVTPAAAPVDPSAPPPPAPTQGAAAIDSQGYYTAPRPIPTAAPVYTPPTYRETPVKPLDVSQDAYQQSPDFNFQQEQGNKNILATASATGGLESGAALKALQKYGQDLAMGDYGQWRDYTTNTFNNDRSYTANRDDAYNAFGSDQAKFGFNASQSNYQYGTNLAQSLYDADRNYTTGRYDTGTNALFNLAGIGQGAATNYNNALSNSANATSSAYFNNANNQGNSALASAGQINGAAANGANALAFYYGNNGAQASTTPSAANTVAGLDKYNATQKPALSALARYA